MGKVLSKANILKVVDFLAIRVGIVLSVILLGLANGSRFFVDSAPGWRVGLLMFGLTVWMPAVRRKAEDSERLILFHRIHSSFWVMWGIWGVCAAVVALVVPVA